MYFYVISNMNNNKSVPCDNISIKLQSGQSYYCSYLKLFDKPLYRPWLFS